MTRYAKFTTTVIGAHSVPDWFKPLDRLLALGRLSMASIADAQFRATQAAILDQELAGIDVITGRDDGPIACLAKPYAQERLVATLRSLIPKPFPGLKV